MATHTLMHRRQKRFAGAELRLSLGGPPGWYGPASTTRSKTEFAIASPSAPWSPLPFPPMRPMVALPKLKQITLQLMNRNDQRVYYRIYMPTQMRTASWNANTGSLGRRRTISANSTDEFQIKLPETQSQIALVWSVRSDADLADSYMSLPYRDCLHGEKVDVGAYSAPVVRILIPEEGEFKCKRSGGRRNHTAQIPPPRRLY